MTGNDKINNLEERGRMWFLFREHQILVKDMEGSVGFYLSFMVTQ